MSFYLWNNDKFKKRIKKYSKKILNDLINEFQIDKNSVFYSIKLTYNQKSQSCYMNNYGNSKININFMQLCFLLKIKSNDFTHNYFKDKYKLNSVYKRLYFIIAHEFGHYYHNKFYKNSFNNCYREYINKSKNINDCDYRKLRAEWIADKIALGIMKRKHIL